ncbi:MAG: N4-gp56 family major capsid protein [Geminicoccaceae bacterium]
MAVRTFGSNDPLTNKLYAKMLAVESITQTYVRKFMGSGPNSLIQVRNDTQKNAGDRITIGLRVKLTGAGVLGGNTLEGNEEAFVTNDDSIIINKLRHAARVKGQRTIEQQRVPFDLRYEALDDLSQWWGNQQDLWAANQLTGNTAQTDVRFTGLQATVAPDANHILRPTGAATDQATAGAGAFEFNLTAIDVAVERAKTLEPLIRPIRIMGQMFYVCFIHPEQVTDLRTTAQDTGTWYDIQARALSGGEISRNPIFSGALGVYNQTILHEWERLPNGVDVTGAPVAVANTRRALFCGAQSAWAAFGQGFGPGRFNWVEKLFDYDEELGVSAGCIGGLKKSRFNGADFGTIAITTRAVANTTFVGSGT